jgi:hypothetical protein
MGSYGPHNGQADAVTVHKDCSGLCIAQVTENSALRSGHQVADYQFGGRKVAVRSQGRRSLGDFRRWHCPERGAVNDNIDASRVAGADTQHEIASGIVGDRSSVARRGHDGNPSNGASALS